MAFVTGQGTQHGPLLNFGAAQKTGTQSFGASSSFTTISGMSVSMALQHANNYFLVMAQLTIGCGSATSVIATLQAGGTPIDALRGASDGVRLRSTSRSSQDNQYEAHTIPLVGMYSPGNTNTYAFTVAGATNAGTFWVNRSQTSNNDTSRDSTRSFSSIQVFEFHS